MFLYKNLFFFNIFSVISIPIMLIGINGGYFPAICRVCFLIAALIFSAGYYGAPILFYFVEQKNVLLYLILPLFQHFA